MNLLIYFNLNFDENFLCMKIHKLIWLKKMIIFLFHLYLNL